MARRYDLRLAAQDVVIRSFRVAPPDESRFFAPIRFAASPRPVQGFLVGVTDGHHWGWWGPVTEEIALQTRALFARATGQLGESAVGRAARRVRGTPEQCSDQLRRATRHAHSGILSVCRGVFELSCWDLLGQRYGVPVWSLLTSQAAVTRVRAYATCFGVRLDHPAAAGLAREVGAVWPIQKWRPVRKLSVAGSRARLAAEAAGLGCLALDFCGAWPLAAALRYCAALRLDLAWIEEPCPPGALSTLRTAIRPAPVAAGEHCYGPDETAILAHARVDIWQPDAVFCGGFSALRTIISVAAGRPVYPHGGGLIPALHAAVAGDAVDLVEFHLLLEPRRQVHLAHPIMPAEDGSFGIPELAGWAGPLRGDLW